VRSIVEASGARWFILSARYELVAPDVKIKPYNCTLKSVAKRRKWAKNVLDKLLPEMASEKRVVIFAGRLYREFLVDPLRHRGIKVEVPMANLGTRQTIGLVVQTFISSIYEPPGRYYALLYSS
jgi:uncharacterized protein DUF6884